MPSHFRDRLSLLDPVRPEINGITVLLTGNNESNPHLIGTRGFPLLNCSANSSLVAIPLSSRIPTVFEDGAAAQPDIGSFHNHLPHHNPSHAIM
jgi:hypothetical protein